MLEALHLTNFKAFHDQEICLAPLTLLSGLNGVGKSTTLQSMALLRQSHEAGLLRDDGLLLNGELIELGIGRDVMFNDADQPWIEIGILEDGCQRTWRGGYDSEGDVLPFPPEQVRTAALGVIFGSNFQYLRADRVNPAAIYGKSYHAVKGRRFMGARGEFAAHFLSLFQDEVVAEPLRCRLDNGYTTGLLSQVNAWMQEFSPDVSIAVHDVANTDFVRLSYSYGGSAGLGSSNPYRPTNVGFGLTYSLPIVIACLSTPRGGLLLLENPEAHLHPQGQVAMGRLMALAANTGVQVLVETHSDHVLNGIRLTVKNGELRPDQVAMHFFRRGENGVADIESPTMTGKGRLSFWPEGFFDQWDKSLDELLD